VKDDFQCELPARQVEAVRELGERQAVTDEAGGTEPAVAQQLPDGGLLCPATGVGADQALLVLEEIVEHETCGFSGLAVGEEDGRSARPEGCDRQAGERAAADTVVDGVGALAVRAHPPHGGEELLAGSGRRVGSELERQPAAVLAEVDHHDADLRCERAQDEQVEQSHAPGAEDGGDPTAAARRRRGGHGRCLRSQGLEESALRQTAQNAGRGLEEDGVEVVEAVRQAAGRRGERTLPDEDPAGETARFEEILAKRGALGIGAGTTVETGAARGVMRNDDAIAGREGLGTFAGRQHLADDFMSQDSSRSDASARQLEQVGAAEAAPAHLQQELAGSRDRVGAGPPMRLSAGIDRDDFHRGVSFHQMERRIHRRFPRRIELRFWRPGEVQGHTAYTTNISKSGLFLNSAIALMIGERLRLELVDREHGFVAEGKVARVHRVALALRQVDQQGVGIRFLLPEELVEGLVPLARQSGPMTRGGQPVAPDPETGGDLGVMDADGDGADSADGAASEAQSAREAAMDVHRDKVVPVQFPDPASFLSTYHRDITSGGLFVSTPDPLPLQATVWIEMELPIPGERPRLFAARVVQRFEPQAAVGEGRNFLSGMAVQFIEPEKVLEELRPLLAILRR
jgi:Tfp pilus assembly protein PilZ